MAWSHIIAVVQAVTDAYTLVLVLKIVLEFEGDLYSPSIWTDNHRSLSLGIAFLNSDNKWHELTQFGRTKRKVKKLCRYKAQN